MEIVTTIIACVLWILCGLVIAVPIVSWWINIINTIKLRNKLRKDGYGGFADDIDKILHNK